VVQFSLVCPLQLTLGRQDADNLCHRITNTTDFNAQHCGQTGGGAVEGSNDELLASHDEKQRPGRAAEGIGNVRHVL
jgi:hypothetical protein